MRKRLEHKLVVCGVCVAVVALASSAIAVDDGGGRSVFAYGAGNRALAMGGAFGAVSNDASAAMWNPGGLGLVPQRLFAASHATLYGLGFEEQYASFVVPSWRWGAAALTFRRFAVDGIDVRDDRNVLLDDNVSDSETQVMLSYGRNFARAWSLGGSVKLQRHSLAEMSDSGLGLDLGMVVRPGLALKVREPWADRFSVGLVVRNALQPTIRLDQEKVSDPAGARFALAYWAPFGSGRSILAAVDVERTLKMQSRLHLGLEAHLHPLLALRAGSNNGVMTAGTGLRWRDVQVDYVFENNDISSVHRVGASIGFGMTVEENRRAALEAEEAALEAKLAQAFRTRQAERIGGLLRLARTAMTEKRFHSALEFVSTIKVLDPSNVDANKLEGSALLEKARMLEAQRQFASAALAYGQVLTLWPEDATARAGQQRCQNDSDRIAERTSEIRKEFSLAIDAFTAEDFAGARKGFSEILKLNPDDSEAASMLKRTQDAIDRRTGSLLALARRMVQNESAGDAAVLVEQVRQLDPQAQGLGDLETQIAQARHSRPTTSEDTAPPENPGFTSHTQQGKLASAEMPQVESRATIERNAEAEELYRRGVSAMENGRSDDALRYWELVWSANPDHQRVGDHLKREYLMRGMESFAAGDLTRAIRQWEKALLVDPKDARAIGYLARAQEQLARTQEILGNGSKR